MLLGTCSRAVACCVLCALPGYAAPGCRCRLAPVPVPRLGTAACPSGVPRGPAWCAASRLVQSLSVLRSAFRTPWCLCQPRGLASPDLLEAARNTWRPAETRAHCACCWPLPRQGRCACSASYPFGAPRWGFLWRVPPASVLGCVRCGGLRLWTRSLTRPVSRTFRCPTEDSAGAPGLSRVDAVTSSCGSGDATPRSGACVRVHARLGQVGRAGLLGALWCASPFLRPPCPFALLGPLRAWVTVFLAFCLPSPPLFLFFFLPLSGPLVSWFLWFPALDALGLGAMSPPPCFLFFLSFFFSLLVFPFGLLGVRFLPPSFSSFPPLSLILFFSLFFCGFFSLSPPPCLFCGSPAARLPLCSFACSCAVAAPPPAPGVCFAVVFAALR